MSCTSCNDNNSNLYYVDCESTPVTVGCTNIIDAQCIVYKGDDLECTGITTGTRLEAIIQILDAKLCEASSIGPADYSAFNTFCLTTEDEAISTEQEFVESISAYVCNFHTEYETFTTTTYVNAITSLQAQITAIAVPGTTSGCASLVIAGGATIQTILQTYATKICDLYSKLDLSGVNWTQCFSVTSTPTSVAQGFTAILTMLCSLQSDITDLGAIDSYKVKTTSGDSNPDFLFNKLKSTNCAVWHTMTETDGKEKIYLSIPTQLEYSFNTSQFDINTILTDQCKHVQMVSLKTDFLTSSDIPVFDCETLDSVFEPVTANELPEFLYGKDEDGECQKFDNCNVLDWLFGGSTTGSYNIAVDTSAEGCSKVYLEPATVTTTNIYGIDGALTDNRTLDGDGYSLAFNDLSSFFVTATNSIFTGHLKFGVDTTYDIGTTSAGRPRNLHLGNYMRLASNVMFLSTADGNLLLTNGAQDDFGMIQFGNTGSGFPALKRTDNAVDIVKADDSGYAALHTGGFGAAIVTKTTSYTATELDHTILVNATAGDVTITLPTTVPAGRIFILKKIDAETNDMILDPAGAATIDGASTYSTITQWEAVRVQFDGTNYYKI